VYRSGGDEGTALSFVFALLPAPQPVGNLFFAIQE